MFSVKDAVVFCKVCTEKIKYPLYTFFIGTLSK